ncbi:MAG: phosphate ABC transporter substrate-binding protein PstS [Acidimicrobiales bacterium]|nr:phosphate ABC transporter substrate-binding protein PstS [Acidimicrobiales bacterium]HRW36533.1 phosphate ABC transporter substrate-binding protein PstS [Aquihabitans sp.]
MKNRKGLAWLIAVLAVLSFLAAACGSDSDGASSSNGEGDSTTTAASSEGPDTSGYADLSASLDGQGSSFQDTFQQQVSSDFNGLVSDAGGSAAVTYTKTGSSDGKKALADETVDFAGSDSPIKEEEMASFGDREVLYFPLVGGPITVSFNLEGIDTLNLGPDTIAKIFQTEITSWDDEAIAADNPDVDLPSTPVTVVHRSDGSGTTKNFTKWLTEAAPDTWTLDSGEEVEWDAKTTGAEKSTGVTAVIKDTDGAVGYVDLADAAKEGLTVAAIGNASGDFVDPTPDSASAALGAADIADDLTYDPLNADAEGAYPITSPTWMLVDKVQADEATAESLKAYLAYVLTTGQEQAKTLLYAPLPAELAEKAVAQIDEITVG